MFVISKQRRCCGLPGLPQSNARWPICVFCDKQTKCAGLFCWRFLKTDCSPRSKGILTDQCLLFEILTKIATTCQWTNNLIAFCWQSPQDTVHPSMQHVNRVCSAHRASRGASCFIKGVWLGDTPVHSLAIPHKGWAWDG